MKPHVKIFIQLKVKEITSFLILLLIYIGGCLPITLLHKYVARPWADHNHYHFTHTACDCRVVDGYRYGMDDLIEAWMYIGIILLAIGFVCFLIYWIERNLKIAKRIEKVRQKHKFELDWKGFKRGNE